MITLFLLLALADGREVGVPKNITIQKDPDGKYRGRASCYTATNRDGGFDPWLIKCEANSESECQTQLDSKAQRGCK